MEQQIDLRKSMSLQQSINGVNARDVDAVSKFGVVNWLDESNLSVTFENDAGSARVVCFLSLNEAREWDFMGVVESSLDDEFARDAEKVVKHLGTKKLLPMMREVHMIFLTASSNGIAEELPVDEELKKDDEVEENEPETETAAVVVEEEDFLLDSRMGISNPPKEYKGVSKLSRLATKCLAENLLLFEGVEEVPVDIRGRIFTYLIRSSSISSKKLKMLVSKDLTKLDLSSVGSFVHDLYCDALVDLPNLTRLNLSNCTGITSAGFEKMLKCNKLTEIYLANTTVDDSIIGRMMPSLQIIDFSGCKNLKSAIQTLVGRCDKLKTLCINDCTEIPWSNAISLFGEFWPSFERLEARNCGNVRGTILSLHRRIAQGCKCSECSIGAVAAPYAIESLRGKKCYGYYYDLTDCLWLNNFSLVDSQFPFVHTVLLGGISVVEALNFATRCPALLQFGTTGSQELLLPQTFKLSPSLTKLTLSSFIMPWLSLVSIIKNQPRLVEVSLVDLGPEIIARSVLTVLVASSKFLTHLTLGKLSVSPGKSFEATFEHVTYLKLKDMTSLHDDELLGLFSVPFPKLSTFVLRGQNRVTRQGLMPLLQKKTITSITIDSHSQIEEPLRVFTFPCAAPIQTFCAFGFTVNQLLKGDEPFELAPCPSLHLLDISIGHAGGQRQGRILNADKLFLCIWKTFKNLRTLRCRHLFFKNPIEVPLSAECKFVTTNGDKVYNASSIGSKWVEEECQECTSMNHPGDEDDLLGFDLFD